MPLGLPNMVIIAIVFAVVVYFFLNYTRTGRNIYALGRTRGREDGRHPPPAGDLHGLRDHRPHCGLAGVLWASRFEAAQTNTALGFELQTVAASVMGGVSICGGIGTVPGVLLGALLLGTIQNALPLSAHLALLAAGRAGPADPDWRSISDSLIQASHQGDGQREAAK